MRNSSCIGSSWAWHLAPGVGGLGGDRPLPAPRRLLWHGAISRNPWVNRLLGMTENWIGGSQINWIHQHVVQHHLHTNDVHLDPDMQVYFFNKDDIR